MKHETPNTRNVPYVIRASMIGVSLAIAKLHSHCNIRAIASTSDRTWLGEHTLVKMYGVNPHACKLAVSVNTFELVRLGTYQRVECHVKVDAHNSKIGSAIKGLR